MFKKIIFTFIPILIIFSSIFIYKNIEAENYRDNLDYLSSIKLDELNQNTEKWKFIQDVSEDAIINYKKYNILPSITISQAILESDFGNSDLSKENNNLFGIKSDDSNKSIDYKTDEYIDGKKVQVIAGFETFKTKGESIDRHSLLFVDGTTDNPDRYKKVLQAENYEDAAIEVQKAGYATDPSYSKKLISIIREWKLYIYDK